MAEIRIPVLIDLDDLSALTVMLPAAAKEAGDAAGEALSEGLAKGGEKSVKIASDLAARFKRLKQGIAGLREENAKLLPEFNEISKVESKFLCQLSDIP